MKVEYYRSELSARPEAEKINGSQKQTETACRNGILYSDGEG